MYNVTMYNAANLSQSNLSFSQFRWCQEKIRIKIIYFCKMIPFFSIIKQLPTVPFSETVTAYLL